MKKALSIVLALLMLLAMIPASLAQETAPVVYVTIADQGLKLVQERRWIGIVPVAVPFVLPTLLETVLPAEAASLLTGTLLPSPYTCEGGIEFIMIGVLLYFFRRDKKTQLTAYVVGTLVLYLTPVVLLGGFPLLFTYYQWMMVFAAIPLALYNGERGSAPRWLFYLFYPTHIYLLWALGALLGR